MARGYPHFFYAQECIFIDFSFVVSNKNTIFATRIIINHQISYEKEYV